MDSDIVYSTDSGWTRPSRANSGVRRRKDGPSGSGGDGKVRVGKQTKGRKGKVATLITGLPHDSDKLKKLAKQLKKAFGCGGSAKNGAIELQGDRRDQAMEELKKLGYDAKRSG